MKAKRLAQESRSPGVSGVPRGMSTGEGSIEIAPGVYTCCQCSAATPLSEAFRQPTSVSFGAMFCPTCAMEVSRCYNMSLSPVALNPVERLNMMVGNGATGDQIPTLEQLGFGKAAPTSVSEPGVPVVSDEIVDIDEITDID